MEQGQKNKEQKIKIYITIEPFNTKFGAVFKKNDSINTIAQFVNNQMKKLQIKFETGRIELKEKLAILVPEFTIGDFLENDSEVTVYSTDYGLNMRTLPGDGIDHRLPFFQKVQSLYKDHKMLGQKTERDNKNKGKNNNKSQNLKKNEKKDEKKNDQKKGEKQKQDNKQRQDSKQKQKNEKKNENQKDASEKKNKSSNKKDESQKDSSSQDHRKYVPDSEDEEGEEEEEQSS